METPKLLVPEYEKTTKWIEGVALWIKRSGLNSNKDVDAELWRYYHNSMKTSRFDYFLTVGSDSAYQLPAKARHIPLQRHLIDLLVSELVSRPRQFDVSTIDQDSIDKKQNDIIIGIIGKMLDASRRAKMSINVQMSNVEQKISQIQEMANKKPETPEEEQEIQRVRSVLPAIMAQVEYLQQNMQTETELIDKEAKDIERYYKMDYKDIKEEITEVLLDSLYGDLKIKDKEKKAFISNCVTGKHCYFVDQLEGEIRPRFEVIDSMKVHFPQIDGVDRIQDGPWSMIYESMAFHEIVIEFGDAIVKRYGKSRLNQLEDLYGSSSGATMVSTPDGGMFYDNLPYSGSERGYPGIPVARIFFKSPRREEIKYSPNPHEKGDYFRHFINPMNKAINEDLYTFDSKNNEYVSKDNPEDRIRKQDASTYSIKKGQFTEYRYTNDLYEAVVIDNDIIVHARKKRFCPRSTDRHSDIKGPVFGRSFSSYVEKPYSLIYATKDIQELYDVVYTQIELMLALAGTKSVFLDRSQKPGDMSDLEWNEQKKLGNIWIQSTDKNGNPIRSTFSQWSQVDLTLSSSVQYLENILARLEESMGNIIGIPRQRLAQTKDSDQVGTFKESIKRSYLITEILFNDHEEILEEALTHLLNIAGRYTYRNGGKIELNKRGFGRRIVSITKDMLRFVDLRCMVERSGDTQVKLQELREMAAAHYKQGQLPFSSLLEIFDSNTMRELKSKVEYFSGKAEELAARMRKEDAANVKQLETDKIRFANEFDAFWKQKELELKTFTEQFNQKNEEFKRQIEKETIDLEKLRLEAESKLKLFELMNEKESEDNAVEANMSVAKMNAKLKAIEIQLNYIMNNANLSISKDKNDKDHTEKIKKIDGDLKAKKIVKEHVSDK